nr:MAG TPA: hypothetical protein [Caudoviricetes sp.]
MYRFSLAGLLQEDILYTQIKYIISGTSWQGAYFLYSIYCCDTATPPERMILWQKQRN